MRFSVVAAVLACASSTLGAYTVLTPNTAQGWTNQGPQPCTWTRAPNDPVNITIILTNPDPALMTDPQVLLALVDGDLGKANLNPPSAGWPAPGNNYTIQFVRNVTDLTVLAQSQPFEIKEPNVTSTSTSQSSTSALNTFTAPNAAPTDTTIGGNDDNKGKDNGAGILAIPAAGLLSALFLIPTLF